MNLIYYGTGNPSTWNPTQRPGDNKWSMAIFARDADTGAARWVYQMTPHDEWDYDGVNEMILNDAVVEGRSRRLLTHFDRNGFAYVLDRANGELISADKYDPAVNWARRIDLDRASKSYGRPVVDEKYSTEQNGEETQTKGVCPATVGVKNANPAAFSAAAGLFYVPMIRLCMDYEPFRIIYAEGQPYTGADTRVYPEPGEAAMGGLVAWDAGARRIVWSDKRAFRRCLGRSRDRGRPRLLRHAGRLSEGGRRSVGQGALPLQDAVRHRWRRDEFRAWRPAIYRRPVGRGRLVRRRPHRGADPFGRGREFPGRLCGAHELHGARRATHGVRIEVRLRRPRPLTRAVYLRSG